MNRFRPRYLAVLGGIVTIGLATLGVGPASASSFPGGVSIFDHLGSGDTNAAWVPELRDNVVQVAVGKLDVHGNVISTSTNHADGGCHCVDVFAVDDGTGGLNVAVMGDATVRAWGSNDKGQLGDGTTTQQTTPRTVPGLTNVKQVSAGYRFVLAVKKDGTVWSWGSNSAAQLGFGAPPPGTTDPYHTTPAQVPGLSGIVQVSAGDGFGMALGADGKVWAWGSGLWDGDGRSGLGPVQVAGLPAATQVAAGYHHAVALDSTGKAWAWGFARNGQATSDLKVDGLPTGTAVHPISIQGLPQGITQIAAGFHESYAIAGGDGSVWAWGGNGFMAGLHPDDLMEIPYGDGPTGSEETYTYDHSFMAIDTISTARRVNLGDGGANPSSSFPGRVYRAAQISANYATVGVVLADGTVWDWDINNSDTSAAIKLWEEPKTFVWNQIAAAPAGPPGFRNTLVLGPSSLQIGLVPDFLTKMDVLQTYQLQATGGLQPYTWSVTGLPTGLAFTSNGAISGTPTVPGVFNVAYTLTDGAGVTTTRYFVWEVTVNETRFFTGAATASKPTTALSAALSRAQSKATNAGFALRNCEETDSSVDLNEFRSYDASATLKCIR
ncbi:putative Ig domain-containing protein [Dactylosporangium sp. NBC_01737]|uniref:putative Ig domain-containing protein n=1 Tax=Dactylosporangium sp. NBC_01737 TaxID=2975959 RepID=UPI002E0F708B|nr:putative Ig domain-containing protein [Dactylosporangium sp. NBC_01737]